LSFLCDLSRGAAFRRPRRNPVAIGGAANATIMALWLGCRQCLAMRAVGMRLRVSACRSIGSHRIPSDAIGCHRLLSATAKLVIYYRAAKGAHHKGLISARLTTTQYARE